MVRPKVARALHIFSQFILTEDTQHGLIQLGLDCACLPDPACCACTTLLEQSLIYLQAFYPLKKLLKTIHVTMTFCTGQNKNVYCGLPLLRNILLCQLSHLLPNGREGALNMEYRQGNLGGPCKWNASDDHSGSLEAFCWRHCVH